MHSKEILKWNEKKNQEEQKYLSKHRQSFNSRLERKTKYMWIKNGITKWKVGCRWKAENTMKPTDVRNLFKDQPEMLQWIEDSDYFYGSELKYVKTLTAKEKIIKLLRS